MRSKLMTQVGWRSILNLKGLEMGQAIGGGGKASEEHGESGDEP